MAAPCGVALSLASPVRVQTLGHSGSRRSASALPPVALRCAPWTVAAMPLMTREPPMLSCICSCAAAPGPARRSKPGVTSARQGCSPGQVISMVSRRRRHARAARSCCPSRMSVIASCAVQCAPVSRICLSSPGRRLSVRSGMRRTSPPLMPAALAQVASSASSCRLRSFQPWAWCATGIPS